MQDLCSYNSLENPIGIETCLQSMLLCGGCRYNSLENPIGIETPPGGREVPRSPGYNSLENPIGIETDDHLDRTVRDIRLQLIRKPDRD